MTAMPCIPQVPGRPARRSVRAFVGTLALAAFVSSSAVVASVPVGPLVNKIITLDGTPLGSAIANRSAVPTIVYDAGAATWHMWVQVADETAFTSAGLVPLRIASYRHATSTDGVAFATAATLSFAGNPFGATIYGSTFGEPPWVYPKASVWNGSYTLGLWTINDSFSGAPYPGTLGDYNYNISLNDIGASPDNVSPTHLGPVGAVTANGIFGQTAGHFGIVGGVMYYDNNSLLGRAALTDNGAVVFPAAFATGPWRITATNTAVADTLTPLGYVACHLPGGNTYLHNSARVIANGDGTLGFFYSVRNCDGSRKDAQIYYMESPDDGLTWSSPAGIFAGAATIGGNALASGYGLADVAIINGQRIVYFNAFDAAGDLIVGAFPPVKALQVPVPAMPAGGLAALAALLACAAASALRARRG
jgi:hypothetical protein